MSSIPVMQRLLTDSVVVLPLDDLQAHDQVQDILLDICELKDPVLAVSELEFPLTENDRAQIVMGGFGATGLPSLSHMPRIRALRQAVYSRIAPMLAQIHPNRRLELLFDRFSIRRKGTSVTPESWHRDNGPKSDGDIIYGGWINLDKPGSPSQQFSCIPGDINDDNMQGFAKFDKANQSVLDAAAGGPIQVPSGAIILFDQKIAHKITGGNGKNPTSYRMYFGWRITDDSIPLYDKATIIRDQTVPPLPSGQKAPMYSPNHWSVFQKRVRDFSETFHPEFLELKKSIHGNGMVVARFMPGLVATGYAYEPYSQQEIDIFYPQLLSSVSESKEPPLKRSKH